MDFSSWGNTSLGDPRMSPRHQVQGKVNGREGCSLPGQTSESASRCPAGLTLVLGHTHWKPLTQPCRSPAQGRHQKSSVGGRAGSHSPETWEAGPQHALTGFSSHLSTERRPKAATLNTPLTLHCAGDRSDAATLCWGQPGVPPGLGRSGREAAASTPSCLSRNRIQAE